MSGKNKKFTNKRAVNKKKLSPWWLVVPAIVLVLVGWLIYQHPRDNNDAASTGANLTANTPGSTSGQNNSSSGATGSDKSASSAGEGSTDSTPTSTPPKAPYGTFVSNHHPGANGSPMTIDSVCITTAGAKCYIQFTQGSVTKQLATKTVGGDGYAHWNAWQPKDIGLTSGSWQITAVAVNGNNSVSTKDGIALEVQ